MKRTHAYHNPVSINESSGQLSLHLLCPDCEARGVTLTPEQERHALMQVEEALAQRGLPPLAEMLDDEGVARLAALGLAPTRTTH